MSTNHDLVNSPDSQTEPNHEPPPPKPLFDQPTATIYFDGLIYSTYDSERKVYQAGILVEAEHHNLRVEITANGQHVFPNGNWNPSLEKIREIAPLWLFVDSGNGLQPNEFSASLYEPDNLKYRQSFGHIFDFEREYQRGMQVRNGKIAAFNIANGVAYSADNVKADLKSFAQNRSVNNANFLRKITVSTLGAIDIDDVSADGVQRYIVLTSEGGKEEFFRLPLEEGVRYEIKVMNVPEHDGSSAKSVAAASAVTDSGEQTGPNPVMRPEDHFLQFYELFDLQPQEPKFIVNPAQAALASTDFGALATHPDAPPCIPTKGGNGGG